MSLGFCFLFFVVFVFFVVLQEMQIGEAEELGYVKGLS